MVVAFSGLWRPVSPSLPYDYEGTSCFLVHWTILLEQSAIKHTKYFVTDSKRNIFKPS